MNRDLAIVFPSTDKYADVWPLTLEAFARFWPDCPIERVLVTNARDPSRDGVRALPMGDDTTWSDMLARALRRIDARYVLLWIDDLVLTGRVDGARFARLAAWAMRNDARCLRLHPKPRGVTRVDALLGVREHPPGALYRTSTVFALWQREALLALLRPEESAWQFEIEGTRRADALDRFYVVEQPLFRFENIVVKGRIDPRAAAVLAALDLPVGSLQRATLDAGALRILRAKELRNRLLAAMPWRWQRGLRRAFAWTGVAGREAPPLRGERGGAS